MFSSRFVQIRGFILSLIWRINYFIIYKSIIDPEYTDVTSIIDPKYTDVSSIIDPKYTDVTSIVDPKYTDVT